MKGLLTITMCANRSRKIQARNTLHMGAFSDWRVMQTGLRGIVAVNGYTATCRIFPVSRLTETCQ